MKIITAAVPDVLIIEGVDYAVLPLEFYDRGFYHIQLFRNGDICLYEVRDDVGVPVSYELIKVKRTKGNHSVIGGVAVEFKAKENYPSDESFGVNGFCFSSNCKHKALAAFQNATEFFKSKNEKLS